jgi:hypothetical protein
MHEITVHVSEPYTVIAGSWTGMRPVGRRRDYAADVLGRHIVQTSKDEIQRRIRQLIYRDETARGVAHQRVRFTFVPVQETAK